MERLTPELIERLQLRESDWVDWEGKRVYMIYRLPLPKPARIEQRAIKVGKKRPKQGIDVAVSNGTIRVGDERQEGFAVFYSDTLWANLFGEGAPTEFDVTDSMQDRRLELWHVWEGTGGSIDAWLGNCGMLVDDRFDSDARVITLHCSCGWNDLPTFTDLVAEVRITPIGWFWEDPTAIAPNPFAKRAIP
ncbi:MAG: hypothetical protein WAO58_12025 [Fimbriimonadaceae bacterium]